MLNRNPAIELYQPRPGWDSVLILLGGSEYRVWRSLRTATPEAHAKLLKLVKQWQAIERDAHPSTKDQEKEFFMQRLDPRAALLVQCYPAPGWLLMPILRVGLLLMLTSLALVILKIWLGG